MRPGRRAFLRSMFGIGASIVLGGDLLERLDMAAPRPAMIRGYDQGYLMDMWREVHLYQGTKTCLTKGRFSGGCMVPLKEVSRLIGLPHGRDIAAELKSHFRPGTMHAGLDNRGRIAKIPDQDTVRIQSYYDYDFAAPLIRVDAIGASPNSSLVLLT